MTTHCIDQDNPQLPYVDVVHAAAPVEDVNPAAAALEGDAELQFRPEFRRYTRLSGPTGMKPFTYAVRECLGDFARSDGYAWPTIKQMADLTGFSCSSVKRALQELDGVKQIEILEVHPDYDMRRNVYRFTAVDRGLMPEPRVPLKDGVVGKLLEENRTLQASNNVLLGLLEEHGIEIPEELMVPPGEPTVVVVVPPDIQESFSLKHRGTTTTTPRDMVPTELYLAEPYLGPEVEAMKAWARKHWPELKARGIESLGGITNYWTKNMERYSEFREGLDVEKGADPQPSPAPEINCAHQHYWDGAGERSICESCGMFICPECGEKGVEECPKFLPELDADPDAQAAWEQVKDRMRAILPVPTFESYLADTAGVVLAQSGEHGSIVVACSSAFEASYLERRPYKDLLRAAEDVLGEVVDVRFVVGMAKKPGQGSVPA